MAPSLLRQRLFEFSRFLRTDRLCVQVAIYDAIFVVRNLPPEQNLVRVLWGDRLAAVERVLLLLNEPNVEPNKLQYGFPSIANSDEFLFSSKPFYLFLQSQGCRGLTLLKGREQCPQCPCAIADSLEVAAEELNTSPQTLDGGFLIT